MSSELIERSLPEWRKLAREGTLPPEQWKIVIDLIRADRIKAAGTSATAKETKAAAEKKKQPIDSDALLGDLML